MSSRRGSSPSSRSSSDVPSKGRRSRSRSSSRDSGEIEEQPVSPRSPRIPKRSEFTLAIDTVPPPPRIVSVTAKERIKISEAARARFEELAAGLFLPSADRANLIKELPFVNSTLALVPSVDDQLRAALFEKGVMVTLKLADVWRIHETLLVGLNLREMVEKIGSDGKGSPFDASVLGYLEVMGRLNGATISELVKAEREAVLK
ncbi:hypothetical protein WR25_25310 [Diploscapter pachys]|uniref:Uncharacterized protein n=1 Tax=Diploscapter pachys TaxID=2018661 RepID=A0A2A2JE90_9BILA|nr:hypothetical protein WR25_25310 [Diploscapter pachys]